jgi:hypothetical protein
MLVHDPAAAHYPVDAGRLDLVEEFRRRPRGPHSDDLQKLLHRMRWPGDPGESGRFVLIVLDPGRQWGLARLPRRRGARIERLANHVFASLEEAEWHVFKVRWRALTGQALTQSLTEPVA